MGFLLLTLLLVLNYTRPWEFYPGLAAMRLPFWTGNLGLLFGVTGFALGGRYNVLASPAPWLLAGFFFLLVVSPVLAAGWWGAVPIAITRALPNVLACALIIMTARTLGKMRVLAATVCVLSLFLTAQSVLAYHGMFASEQLVATQRTDEVLEETGQRGEFGRVVGTGQFNDANDLAQALLAAAPLLWPLWRRRRVFRNFFLIVAPTLALLYGVYLTKSRGAIIAIMVVAMLLARERLTRFRLVGPAMLAVGLGAAMMAAGFSGGRDIGGDASTEGRIDAWYAGIQMLMGSPLVGVGYGLFTEHHERAAHNSFVHCFAELGLIGYSLWIGLLVAVHSDLLRLKRPAGTPADSASYDSWADAIRFSLYAFLAGAFFLSRTYASTLYMILGLGIALAGIARRSGRLGPADVGQILLHTMVAVVGSILAVYAVIKVS